MDGGQRRQNGRPTGSSLTPRRTVFDRLGHNHASAINHRVHEKGPRGGGLVVVEGGGVVEEAP